MHQPLTPFEGMDIRDLLDRQAERRSGHPLLIWEPLEGEGRQWTYDEGIEAIRRFAAGLHKRGVVPGERVLIHSDNCPEMLIAWLGCAYAGVVPVTTNARSTLDELRYFAQHSRAVAAITQADFADLVLAAAPSVRWRALIGGAAEGGDAFDAFAAIDADPDSLPDREHLPMAPFGIQYTSGTTSRPKAVLWTHANALWGGRMSALHEDLRAEDVHLVHLPLFHTNAQVYSVLASIWVGATVVLLPRFSASRFWPISLRHKATWVSMVPFCVKALLDQPVPQTHYYRYWGNAICEPALDQHFRVTTIGWWGMTETVTHGVVGAAGHANASMSMGRPSPGYAVHVVDDAGEPVRPGDVGDLLIGGQRGVSLFFEYVDNPEATASSYREDGLFMTGDRVMLGRDGFIYFADRSKDMLKVGGENVAASEIEQAILEVPGVQEVAVVARPHAMLDEVPVAFVIAKDDARAGLEEQIMGHCCVKLARFKRPEEVRLVDSLPRATLGKVAKAELRALLLQGERA